MSGRAHTESSSPYVYRYGTAPNTALVNTLKVKIFSFNDDPIAPEMVQIGVLQTWGPSDTRTNTAVRGIGYGDQIAEVNPGVTELSATAEIMALYTRNLMQVFGYVGGSTGLVRSLKHHRWPFDVREEIVMPLYIGVSGGQGMGTYKNSAGDAARNAEVGGQAVVTYYEGCWMNEYGRSFGIADVSVTESTTLTITDVYDPYAVGTGVYGEGTQGGNGGSYTNGKSRLFNAFNGDLPAVQGL